MSIKGKVMIRIGNEWNEPCVVYVSHLNIPYNKWVTAQINTGYVHLSEESDLIEFNFKLFNQMLYTWKIDSLPNERKRLEELLSEWN